MNRKSLKILVLVGSMLILAVSCGKGDRLKKNYISCSQEIIEFSKTLDLKSGSYLEQLKQKVLEIGKKYNFQGIPQLKAAYEKYIKLSDPRLGEILQKIENVQPGKISKESPSGTGTDIDNILEEHEKNKAVDEKSFLIGCERGDNGRVLYFLDKGVDINARDEKTGKTGLHYAVEGFYAEIVLILLKKGANPNIRSFDGLTPILIPGKIPVLQSGDVLRHTEIIDLLINGGANVNDQTGVEGLNVLGMYFLDSPGANTVRIAKYLLEKGADINVKTTSDMEWEDKFIPAGSTLLDIMTAINYSYSGAIYFLKKNGAKHGIWAKYYRESVEKKDFIDTIDSKVEPVKKPEEPVEAKEKPKGELKKKGKLPSEVVVAAYMAGNKGNYAEAEKYIHPGFLAGTKEADRTQDLKKQWDNLTRGKDIEKIEILGQELQEDGATVYLKIHFKDGKIKVVKTQLIEEEENWKITAFE